MADSLTEARKRQIARLDGGKPPTARKAMALIDRGFDHLDQMQTEASQRSKCPVPQAMPADQKAKAAVQRAPAALARAKRPVRR